MLEIFGNVDAWVALLTLTFLEIILGIDNIIFISIAAGKLREKDRKKATQLGLFLAMLFRLLMLFGITVLISLEKPVFIYNQNWFSATISWQAIILFAGGLFLLYKSTKEIHEKVDRKEQNEKEIIRHSSNSLVKVVIQISIINIVFSFDSILTAIGMTNGISTNPNDALILMVLAVVISVIIMLLFAHPVGKFVSQHPSIQILGLSFLILIGFMLIAEASHLSNVKIFNQTIGAIPKGYLYFAIAFSLLVEFLNMKLKNKK